jgi:hypothetical protein
MKLKDIFQLGMQERKRRKALQKKRRDLQEKTRQYKDQLTVLGQKGWEAGIPLHEHGDLKNSLAATHKQLDELRARSEELQQQKAAAEAGKKQEMERFKAGLTDLEAEKKDLDDQLTLASNSLKDANLEAQLRAARLSSIATERDYLNKKTVDPAVPEAEKSALQIKLESLAEEGKALQAKSPIKAEEIQKHAEKVSLIQSQSDQMQKQIDALREEQKKTEKQLNQTLAVFDKDFKDCAAKLQDAEKSQNSNFLELGEKLVAAPAVEAALSCEMSAARATEKATAAIEADRNQLESQKTDAGPGAYNRMMAIIIGGAVLIAAVVILLIVFL